MLDAALLAAAPAGRFATRFDDIADGVSALGRAANSEFTDRLLRLHFDEIGSLKWLPDSVPKLSGRGSTASPANSSTLPRSDREHYAVLEAWSTHPRGALDLGVDMTDPRWPGSEGWQKWAYNVKPGGTGGNIEVHYVYNPRTNEIDDFKIKLTRE